MHVKVCSSVVGNAYRFNNRNILSFQYNFKFMGYLPFKVYFDFETRPETVWLMIINFVCYWLLSNIRLQPIAKSSKNCGLQELSTKFWGDQFFGSIFARTYPIFWSSDHGSDEDAATKVFNRKKKPAALPQLFTIELKVIIDSAIKRKFLELNYLQKLAFI